MNKEEIIKELTLCIDYLYSLENVAIGNRLNNIRTSLVDEWSESDMYYEQIRQTLKDEQRRQKRNNIIYCIANNNIDMDINEKAYWKATSKIAGLQRESVNYATLIVTGKTDISEEHLIKCLESTDRDLEVWKYILKLIKNDSTI